MPYITALSHVNKRCPRIKLSEDAFGLLLSLIFDETDNIVLLGNLNGDSGDLVFVKLCIDYASHLLSAMGGFNLISSWYYDAACG